MLGVVLNSRPWVAVVWAMLVLLGIAMFLLSPRELAPKEDQGFMFGIFNTPSNATLEWASHYTEQVYEVWRDTPEYEFTFQITNPTGGFGGMGLVPWSERERTVAEVVPDVQRRASAIPAREYHAVPVALPGAVIFRWKSCWPRPRHRAEWRKNCANGRWRAVNLPFRRSLMLWTDPDRDRAGSRQNCRYGPESAATRPGFGCGHWWEFCQPLQYRGAATR